MCVPRHFLQNLKLETILTTNVYKSLLSIDIKDIQILNKKSRAAPLPIPPS